METVPKHIRPNSSQSLILFVLLFNFKSSTKCILLTKSSSTLILDEFSCDT